MENAPPTPSQTPGDSAAARDSLRSPVPALTDPNRIRFSDALPGSGIDFVHTDGNSPRQYIFQTVVAGLAVFDYDQDGLPDIYLLNGAAVPDSNLTTTPTNRLYRNLGDWTFRDVTEAAGVGDTGYGLGVAAADYDNDGDQDLYVNNFGRNILYRNNGDGTFTDVTEQAGVGGDEVGAGVVWADVDGDGDVDLYVGNYVDFSYDNYRSRKSGQYEYAAAPQDYDALSDRLYRNDGDGRFTDISVESGLSEIEMPSMGVIALDYDRDGDADIAVACDNAPNRLLRNDGSGRFEDVGVLSGIAHDLRGNNNGSMGIDAGDYDNDGRLDLFVTNYQGELSVLYRNVPGGFFSDVSRFSQAGTASMPHVKWGTGFVDFDLDGHRDLFIACGHFIEHIQHLDDRTSVRVPNFVMQNMGNGKFRDVSAAAGPPLEEALSTKGAAFDDLDGDGDVDVVLLNANAEASLLRNDTSNDNKWLHLSLIGRNVNRDGLGARVTVFGGGSSQTAEVHAGRGYQSDFGRTLHFGLPEGESFERIEVQWLGGEHNEYPLSGNHNRWRLYEGGSAEPVRR
ncbi:CRTAC1 family protein [Roseimaritima sediminicola]|uniref:CRTAC1 family protein n=1 Tax=Roseimaritima sediminicola TaxID=2662066 RepID=UPI001386D461|nr:CRTAC1 family protein [Roseimaritima sediminicola]